MTYSTNKTNSSYKTCWTYLVLFVLLFSFFAMPQNTAHAGLISRAPSNLGLVGYWPLDEGAGIKAGDASGQGNTGTITGATWANGKHGKALSFASSGSTNNVLTSAFASITSTITASAWIYPTSYPSERYTIVLGQSPNGFYMSLNSDGSLNTYWYGKSSEGYHSSGASTVPLNTWSHVAVVWNTDGPYLYVNGVLKNNTASTGTGAAQTVINIGAESPGRQFIGKIDDVRIYNRGLTATEVFKLYSSGAVVRKGVSNSGLVGYWGMDEGRGITAGDSSGNRYLGTIYNATWGSGKKGNAVNFNGSSSYISLASNNDTALKNNISTVAMWAYINSTGPNGYAELYAVTGGARTGIKWEPTRIGVDANSDFYSYYVSTTLALGTWNHIVVEIDRTLNKAKVYVNGVYKGQTSAWAAYTPTATSVKIGANSLTGNGGDYLNGKIDDVRLYNRSLSATEVLALYKQNSTTIGTSYENRLTNGLVGFWTMNGKDYNSASTTAEVLDKSGQGNNGDNVGATLAIGKLGQGLKFNGSSAYVDTGTKFPSITSAISISLWVKPEATQVIYADIVGNHQADFKGMVVQQNAGVTNQYTWGYGDGSGWTNTTGTFNLTANIWQFLTVVKDSTYCYVYINGEEQVGSRAGCSAAISPATSMNFRIGIGFSGGSRYWNGTADEVRVYNRALSANEVKQLYRMGQ